MTSERQHIFSPATIAEYHNIQALPREYHPTTQDLAANIGGIVRAYATNDFMQNRYMAVSFLVEITRCDLHDTPDRATLGFSILDPNLGRTALRHAEGYATTLHVPQTLRNNPFSLDRPSHMTVWEVNPDIELDQRINTRRSLSLHRGLFVSALLANDYSQLLNQDNA